MRCPTCGGSGKFPLYTDVCEVCKGRGTLPDTRLNNPGCPVCKGSGKFPLAVDVCEICSGWGRLPEATNVPSAAVALSTLRQVVSRVKSTQVRAFVQEAIDCAQCRCYRAAVVLSWVGALALLYDCVIAGHLAEFNKEARRRDANWRDAKTPDDLARMKEYDFLQVLEATSVVGKSVKAELEVCLKLRNACGHPNSLQLADSRVAAHIETLVLNVFSMFT